MFGLKREQQEAMNGCFARYAAIERVILYGSRAMGTGKPGSDIDLTIEEDGLGDSDLVKLESELDDLLLPYKIDLSLRRQIDNADLLAHIERVGKVFYARD
jgi:uncharacterized protein